MENGWKRQELGVDSTLQLSSDLNLYLEESAPQRAIPQIRAKHAHDY